MWYIEWYSESPYDLSILYWCLRVLQVTISRRDSYLRRHMLNDLFDSHGIIILIRKYYKDYYITKLNVKNLISSYLSTIYS